MKMIKYFSILLMANGLAGCGLAADFPGGTAHALGGTLSIDLPTCTSGQVKLDGQIAIEEMDGEDQIVVLVDGIAFCRDSFANLASSGLLDTKPQANNFGSPTDLPPPSAMRHASSDAKSVGDNNQASGDPMPGRDNNPAFGDPMPGRDNDPASGDPMPGLGNGQASNDQAPISSISLQVVLKS